MSAANRPALVCVDDEPQVLEGLSLNLRRHYEVKTATSGAAALELLPQVPNLAVIISDMRMPGMDGAAFLSRARELFPNATRLLLTGQADMTSAIAAVNEGQIFRFLTKPCPPQALKMAVDAAAEQHRLVTSERVLLEQTLRGSIKTLCDVLALTSPAAFGRATRVKQVVDDLANEVGLTQRWQIEVAAMLSQLGSITLPPETLERVYERRELTPQDKEMLARVPEATEKLLGNIPRLEVVREILRIYAMPHGRARLPKPEDQELADRCARILHVASDFEALETLSNSPVIALETMQGRKDAYDETLLAALRKARGIEKKEEVKELPLSALRVGMVLTHDVKMKNGTLLVTRGYEVTESFVERARNFRAGTVEEPIRVIVPLTIEAGLVDAALGWNQPAASQA